jgi:hypothetical protein
MTRRMGVEVTEKGSMAMMGRSTSAAGHAGMPGLALSLLDFGGREHLPAECIPDCTPRRDTVGVLGRFGPGAYATSWRGLEADNYI